MDGEQAVMAESRGSGDLESTASLIKSARQGDSAAKGRLYERYHDPLAAWIRTQIPRQVRDLQDTADIVQETLLKALDKLNTFEPRREGAFLAYLRQIGRNLLRDELRRRGRRPPGDALPLQLVDPAPGPLEEAIGQETWTRYERALEQLTDEQYYALVGRIEMGFTYPEIAEALGKSSPDAARMLVSRGVRRLADLMNE
jgi:RNA polymerase sigma-70 factor (ECF subfamily)